MDAIFKRELRSHLTSIFGWIFIAVSIGIIGFSVISTNLVSAVPQVEYGLNVPIMAMILTIPFLCMRMFAPENRSGNIKFLLSLPIKAHSIVLGKYLAALTVFAIPTIVLAAIPLALSVYGKVLFAQSYASILSYFLIGAAMIAICMFIGVNSCRSWVTLAVGVLVSTVLYTGPVLTAYIPTAPTASLIAILSLALVIGLLIWLLSGRLIFGAAAWGISAIPTTIAYLVDPTIFNSLFRRIFLFISPFERISRFMLGIFDLGDVIYLLSIAALFLFLTCVAVEGKRGGTKRASIRSIAPAVASLAVIISINLAACAIPAAFITADASGLGIYSLSDASHKFASEADEDVTVYLLSEQGIPDAQIEQILLEYEAASPHIDYKLVNITANPDFVLEYIGVSYYQVNGDGIRPLSNHSIIIESAKRHTVINSSTYYRYKVGSYYYSESEFLLLCQQAASEGYDIAQMGYETFFDLDRIVVSGIEFVTLDNAGTVFTLTGHGEQAIDDSFYSSIRYQGIPYDELDLDSASSVPDFCSALIISAPTTDLSSDDADKIIEYIGRGGDVIMITSPENTNMPNLLRVAEAFGLSAQSGIISDSDKEHHTDGNSTHLILDANADHPVSHYVSTSYQSQGGDVNARFPNAHPIVKTGSSDDGLVIKEIFTTSQKASLSSGGERKYVTGYSAQRVIDNDTENTANLFWYSSYEAFSKEYVKENPINTVYLLVSLSYVGGTQDFETSLDVDARSISGSFLNIPQSIPTVWGIAFGSITLIILCSGIALIISRRIGKRS